MAGTNRNGPKRRRVGWLLLLAVLAAGAGAVALRPRKPILVSTVQVAKGEVREMIPAAAAGEVEPARRTIVRAEIAGTVVQILARAGERVDRGKPIVTFRSDELDARLEQARANVEAARVAVKIAETRRDAASRQLDRARKLSAGGAIAAQELERAESESKALEQTVLQAQAAEKQAEAALLVARSAKDRAVVTAPFAGILQDVMIEVGAQVAPGTSLFDVIDDSSIRLRIPVDEADAAKVELGQRVALLTGSAREEPLLGRVSFIPPAVGGAMTDSSLLVAGRKDRSLHVHVLPDEPARFRIGASVNAEFLVRAKEGVPFVPSRVVIGRGVEREVYLLRDGRARKVRFRPGLTSWDRTEVSSGLSLGDEIISNLDEERLEDGAAVVRRTESATADAPRPGAAAP